MPQTEISDVINQFVEAKQSENKRPTTLDFYGRHLTGFACTIGDIPLNEVTARAIRGHIAEELEHASPHTAHAVYRALLAFFSWCEAQPDLGHPKNPFYHGRTKIIHPPQLPDSEPRRAEPQHVAELLESIELQTWIDARDKAIIALLFATGMRRAELVGLSLKAVDVLRRQLKVTGKGEKDRMLPFTQAASWMLFSYLMVRPSLGEDTSDDSRPLFVGTGGRYKGVQLLTGSGILQMIKRRCNRAEVPYLNPHAFRHGAATTMLNIGADMAFVQRMLGHSDIRVTERYAQWATDGLHRAYDTVWAQALDL